MFTDKQVENKPYDINVIKSLNNISYCLNPQKNFHCRNSKQVADEKSIVSFSYAHTEPRTVMVNFLDADIAVIAVSCSWRSIKKTLSTEF